MNTEHVKTMSDKSPEVTIPPLPEITRDDEVQASRNRALLSSSAELIQMMSAEDILKLQEILQHGNTYGYWSTPKRWCKTRHGQVMFNIDIRQRIQNFLPAELQALLSEDEVHKNHASTNRLVSLIDQAILIQTRYLVLLRVGPAGLGKRGNGRSLDPTTIMPSAYTDIPRLLAICIEKAYKRELNIPPEIGTQALGMLTLLEPEDLDGMKGGGKQSARNEISRMHKLSEHGHWTDFPHFGRTVSKITPVRGNETKRPAERKIDMHLPLPDEYVSEMGVKSLWLIEHLGPNLLTLGTEFLKIWSETDSFEVSAGAVKERRVKLVTQLLKNYTWRDANGNVFTEPPFKIRLTQFGKNSHHKRNIDKKRAKLDTGVSEETTNTSSTGDACWPPRTFGDVMFLMGNLQLAHLFVVSVATAGRKSETLDLPRDCVRYERDGIPYARGRTFKLVERHDGEFRDWVLPDIAVVAIEQQVRLVRCMESIDTIMPDGSKQPKGEEAKHLWAQYAAGSSKRTKPLLLLNEALSAYAKALGMDTEPGGQTFRSHRFRKTIARLLALAITQAPKVIMDVFGHKCIEMALYYVLADKDLQADIEKVCRELRMLMATKTIEEIVAEEDAANGHGGPAANVIRSAITDRKKQLHQKSEEWGASNVAELAEILTLQGKAWNYVRPGIICTKFPGTESGPCNKSKGHPEPARCQSHCNHRLEEPFLREDVEGAIKDCIKEYLNAEANNEELVLEFWASQIRNHLTRFSDIATKWSNDPTVLRIVNSGESVA